MYLLSLFEQSVHVEKAVTALQIKGITKDSILAVPLDRQNEGQLVFDTVHSSDNTSMLALSMILGMIFSLLGAIIGFYLTLGPISWAIFGALAGSLAGFGIRLIKRSVAIHRHQIQSNAGVIVMIRCDAIQADMVHDILWSCFAMGVGILNL